MKTIFFIGMMIFFTSPLFSEGISLDIYSVDKTIRKVREEKEEKSERIEEYVRQLFSNARDQWKKGWEPQEAWDFYKKIQKEVPEELIKKNENIFEAARFTAWSEMKELIEKAKMEEKKEKLEQEREIQEEAKKEKELEGLGLGHFKKVRKREETKTEKFLKTIEPDEKLLQEKFEALKSGWIGFYEISELLQVAMPYLVTKTGAEWIRRIVDLYIEMGDFKEALYHAELIQKYSVGYHKKDEERIKFLKEILQTLPGEEKKNKIDLPIQYKIVMEERGRHDRYPYLVIRFREGGEIRRRIYDIEINQLRRFAIVSSSHEVNLVSNALPAGEKGSILVLDQFGNLEKKEYLTSEEISLKTGIKLSYFFQEADFVLIPKGKFKMGSPINEKNRGDDEREHEVEITHDFYLKATEVTQSEWFFVMKENPSCFKGGESDRKELGNNLDHPVESVSWDDVQLFIQKLNERNDGYEYRLPTEAEWEYAARAQKETEKKKRFYWGDDLEEKEIDQYAWFSKNSKGQTQEVAQKEPNSFGLYDMAGNVWEWVSDWHSAYPTDAVTDPTGPNLGSYRVIRGGSWGSIPQHLRSASRNNNWPDSRSRNLGFRPVRIKKITLGAFH